jgi:hypothetical protein
LKPHPAPINPSSVNWKSIDEITLDAILDSPQGRHSMFQQKGDDAIAIADVLDQACVVFHSTCYRSYLDSS